MTPWAHSQAGLERECLLSYHGGSTYASLFLTDIFLTTKVPIQLSADHRSIQHIPVCVEYRCKGASAGTHLHTAKVVHPTSQPDVTRLAGDKTWWSVLLTTTRIDGKGLTWAIAFIKSTSTVTNAVTQVCRWYAKVFRPTLVLIWAGTCVRVTDWTT